MSDYQYYVYSSSIVARVGEGTTERLMPDGTWVDYPYRWEVLTEGRLLESEKKALEIAEQLYEQERRWEVEEKAIAEYEAEGDDTLTTELFGPQFVKSNQERTNARSGIILLEDQAVDSQSLSPNVSRTEWRPFISNDVEVREVRVSPDGGRVAVAWVRDDLAGIHVGEAWEERYWQPLIEYQGETVSDMAWSPEGVRIAYSIPGQSDLQSKVAWVDVRTPGAELGRVSGVAFAWTPEDRALIVAHSPSSTIKMHDLATGTTRPVVSYNSVHRDDFRVRITSSPEGERVVFNTLNTYEEISRVFCIDMGEETLRVVTQIPSYQVHVFPFWSPNGDSLGLWMLHCQQNTTGLMLVHLPEGTEEILYKNEDIDGTFSPAWSPDGRYIALFRHESTERSKEAVAGVGAGYSLVILDVQKRSAQVLSEAHTAVGDLRFIDDSRLVVDGGTVAHELVISEVPN